MTNAVRLPYTISNQSLTFFVKGKPFSLTREHDRYAEAKQLLLAPGDHDAEHLMALVDARKALLRDSFGAITFIGQDIVFKGQVLSGLWVERILEFQRAGEPFGPLWNALGSLMQNPTPAAIERLPVFLDKSNLGFLEDGRFVAYKAVKDDYFDLHTGNTFRNQVGDTPHMDRDRVDADPNSCCSTGLHVGTPSYVSSWAGNARRVMLIAVWPHDVVAVPYSYEGTKMRICAYEVIDELDDEYAATILGRPVLTPRSQLPAPNDASLPADEPRIERSPIDPDSIDPEDDDQVEDLSPVNSDIEDDAETVIHQPGTVVEYVEFDTTLYGVVDDGDLVRGLDGHLIEPDRINRVLRDHEITAAALICEGAEIRVEGDPAIKDGDYTVVTYSEDDDHNQLDADSWFWRVELRDVDGGVAVMNRAIISVTVRGEQLWPRSVAPSAEVLAAAQAQADRTPLVGDSVEIGQGGWPPAGVYPVVDTRTYGTVTLFVIQTEHDGQVEIDLDQIVRVIRQA